MRKKNTNVTAVNELEQNAAKLFKEKLEQIENGQNLDVFINDPDPRIREVVAAQKYGLDKLVNDIHPLVRVAVARQGYGLEQLINDSDWRVRVAVAEQGFGLDKLVNDPNKIVREVINNYI